MTIRQGVAMAMGHFFPGGLVAGQGLDGSLLLVQKLEDDGRGVDADLILQEATRLLGVIQPIGLGHREQLLLVDLAQPLHVDAACNNNNKCYTHTHTRIHTDDLGFRVSC